MEHYEIYKWFITQTPIMQALYAGLFTWGLTAIGAALVFLFKTSNRKALDISLGFTISDLVSQLGHSEYLNLVLPQN